MSNLAELDLKYNSRGVLTVKSTGKRKETSEIMKNKTLFAQVNQCVQRHIQLKLTKVLNMKEILLPVSKEIPDSKKCNIFVTKDLFKNTEKLIAIIPSKGRIRYVTVCDDVVDHL